MLVSQRFQQLQMFDQVAQEQRRRRLCVLQRFKRLPENLLFFFLDFLLDDNKPNSPAYLQRRHNMQLTSYIAAWDIEGDLKWLTMRFKTLRL